MSEPVQGQGLALRHLLDHRCAVWTERFSAIGVSQGLAARPAR